MAERQEPVTTPVKGAAGAFGWRTAQLAGGQVIALLRLMVLAKLLAPDAFGLVAVATVAIGSLVKATLGLRVSEEQEYEGMDRSEHGENAYPMEP